VQRNRAAQVFVGHISPGVKKMIDSRIVNETTVHTRRSKDEAVTRRSPRVNLQPKIRTGTRQETLDLPTPKVVPDGRDHANRSPESAQRNPDVGNGPAAREGGLSHLLKLRRPRHPPALPEPRNDIETTMPGDDQGTRNGGKAAAHGRVSYRDENRAVDPEPDQSPADHHRPLR
jgi:hypothetical protein